MGLYQPRPLKSLESSRLDYLRINHSGAEAAFGRNEASQLRYRFGRPGFDVDLAGPTLYQVVSWQGGWIVCRPIGSSNVADNISVAVQPELSFGILSEQIENAATLVQETWDYTYDNDYTVHQLRTATLRNSSPAVTELQVITPRYLPNNIVPVWPCANTGIFTNANDATTQCLYITLNSRSWSKVTPVS